MTSFVWGFGTGVGVAFVLVVLGFYWGMHGRTLVSLLTPWLGKLNAVWQYLPKVWQLVLQLLKLLKIIK